MTELLNLKNVPTGSEESTIMASYFPFGEFLRNSTAVNRKKLEQI